MYKGYIAGGLFSEAEQAQRIKEEELLNKALPVYEWFNPLTCNKANDKNLKPTAENIFLGDTREIIASEIIVADLSNNDVGVAAELGIAYGLQYAYNALVEVLNKNSEKLSLTAWYELNNFGLKDRMIETVSSDIRMPNAGDYNSRYVPFGLNQYLVGMIEHMNGNIHYSFDEAVKSLIERESEEIVF